MKIPLTLFNSGFGCDTTEEELIAIFIMDVAKENVLMFVRSYITVSK